MVIHNCSEGLGDPLVIPRVIWTDLLSTLNISRTWDCNGTCRDCGWSVLPIEGLKGLEHAVWILVKDMFQRMRTRKVGKICIAAGRGRVVCAFFSLRMWQAAQDYEYVLGKEREREGEGVLGKTWVPTATDWKFTATDWNCSQQQIGSSQQQIRSSQQQIGIAQFSKCNPKKSKVRGVQ